MGGPGPKCAAEDDDEAPPSTAELLSGANLIDSPILILVYFHKAILAELTYLRRIAVGAESGRVGELRRRFELLKFVYKYHCSAEDEVIFMALDLYIKNVASTYTLEHKGIDDLFDSISALLNVLVEEKESTLEQFQEIVISIGTLRATISRHMVKEEKQISMARVLEALDTITQQYRPISETLIVMQDACLELLTLVEKSTWIISASAIMN